MSGDLSNTVPRSLISKDPSFTNVSSCGSLALGIRLRFDLLICIIMIILAPKAWLLQGTRDHTCESQTQCDLVVYFKTID